MWLRLQSCRVLLTCVVRIVQDQDEPVVLDNAANKRPRVNRWASGAAATRMPVPSQLSKASLQPQQQQQQLQTGKASVVGRGSETVKAAPIEAEEPRKIRLGDLPICQLFALLQHPQAPVLPLPPAFPWLDAG